jgi:hypothetical protein
VRGGVNPRQAALAALALARLRNLSEVGNIHNTIPLSTNASSRSELHTSKGAETHPICFQFAPLRVLALQGWVVLFRRGGVDLNLNLR